MAITTTIPEQIWFTAKEINSLLNRGDMPQRHVRSKFDFLRGLLYASSIVSGTLDVHSEAKRLGLDFDALSTIVRDYRKK